MFVGVLSGGNEASRLEGIKVGGCSTLLSVAENRLNDVSNMQFDHETRRGKTCRCDIVIKSGAPRIVD